MRGALRVLILLLALAYGLQAVAQVQHVHLGEDRHHCTVCAFGSLPGEPATTVEEPLPPECWEGRPVERNALPPPPSIPILRVSFSTSPPVA
ncbi:MAG: hypothetical protein DIU72_007195 [Pseudomonadota bacterium]|nr:MAG: hypothetical protein DIU72_04850 [Pseudomonadota bacterium]